MGGSVAPHPGRSQQDEGCTGTCLTGQSWRQPKAVAQGASPAPCVLGAPSCRPHHRPLPREGEGCISHDPQYTTSRKLSLRTFAPGKRLRKLQLGLQAPGKPRPARKRSPAPWPEHTTGYAGARQPGERD